MHSLASGPGWEQVHQLICAHIKELVQVNSTVCKLAERPPLATRISVRHFVHTKEQVGGRKLISQ